ncbi:MAG: bifunctional phosphopantothenoylcysteine decarboxylase/phosphopantothenate--cysteine ligase CoaBC [Acidimicrobiia bacterium]|nr:bifunctional phosphopantothenoylcysteine decarboxylase/phosphopantothenate--cysteine ligase CoaBC [Acidimicrobiia bacterium]
MRGRRVVLGVSGGVAAYKAAYLARRLVEAGAEVRTIMTPSSRHFIGPHTFTAITGTPAITDLFSGVSPHTELARWGEVIVIAPATAATIGRCANGISSNVLAATVLASDRPLVVAPAMHTEMWEHPATQRNIETLAADGVTIVGPGSGDLAGGDSGIGRLVEPEEIVAAVEHVLAAGRDLAGLSMIVTAGGTREPIDPVRYVGNHSSGKMGFAIAGAAARRGAAVTLVSTVPYLADEPGVDVVEVDTAGEMARAVWGRAAESDVVVMAAAVADFRPVNPADHKIKRSRDGIPTVEFEATEDVLAGVVAMEERPIVVGFAAEAGDLEDAERKAKDKGVDLLVANDIARPGSGFGSDTNEVTVIDADGSSESWELMPKDEVADKLLDRIRDLNA